MGVSARANRANRRIRVKHNRLEMREQFGQLAGFIRSAPGPLTLLMCVASNCHRPAL
jgi:hypothetical protein